MQLRIIPLHVVEEKVYTQLFPPDGDYVTWIRANNPDCPEFEVCNVRLRLFHSEEDEFPHRTLGIPERYESLIRDHLRDQEGFGDYFSVYLEIDIELLLLYTLKSISIVRGPKGKRAAIHFTTTLDGNTLIKDWIEAGMPEPWCK